MKDIIISGIQQIGIGVSNVQEAWKWYRKYFGMDIRVFEESATAELMLPYTGGEPRNRHAALALNLQGGGGFEIWQYTERKPSAPKHEVLVGDLGIYAVKMKSKDIQNAYSIFKEKQLNVNGISTDPKGEEFFYIKDPYQNVFQIVNSENKWFRFENKPTGAAFGAMIGVSNVDSSLKVYSDILGYDEIVYDKTGTFEDLKAFPGGNANFRRVLLKHSAERTGSFSRLFGDSQIELLQVMDRTPKKIFQDRFWGDLGFIHLCYDIQGMEKLKAACENKGFPFTVDSYANHNGNSFDMGEAAGHFSYIEDPDGTLIEFVETHKIPVIKKIGWYLDLKKRNPAKPLPNWIIKALRFGRIKDKE